EQAPEGVGARVLAGTFPGARVEWRGEGEREILASLAASAPGATPERAAELPDSSQSETREILQSPVAARALFPLDEVTGSLVMPSGLREQFLDPAWREWHARHVPRNRTAAWPELETGVQWAVERRDAVLAAMPARRAAARARDEGHVAVAYQWLKAEFQMCKDESMLRQAGEPARELRWICMSWGWEQEARSYGWYSGMGGSTQVILPF
ncbi:MAG: hypothetical protein ACPL88_12720, partial [Bryobacteraceae bacterium]